MKRPLLLILFCLPSCWLIAQDDSEEYQLAPYTDHDRFNFQLSGLVGIPVGELKGAIENSFGNVGVGLTTGAYFNPFGAQKPSPLFLGAEFSYLTYGVDKLEDATPPLKTTFNVYYVNATARLLFTQYKAFVPFADGQVGFRILNTRTKIDKDLLDTALNDDQPFE